MKKETLSDALNLLDDAIIEETDRVRRKKNGSIRKKAHRNTWIKWTAAAACAVLICYVGAQVLLRDAPTENPEPAPESSVTELTMLTIPEEIGDGMGFEGLMAYDISELVNGNPWNEKDDLSTLPVYKNPLTYDESYKLLNADFEKMRELLLEVADRLDIDGNKLEITEYSDDYTASVEAVAESKGIRIRVDQNLTADIDFESAITLPDKYHFTHHSSLEEMQEVADYLKETYSEFIDMDKPQVNIYDGDYNIYGEQSYHVEFFEAAKELTGQISNYNFYRVAFYCNDEGKLYMARVFQPDLSKKMGDYPIISAEEAKELLVNGTYATSVPYEFPGSEYVKKVELKYRTGSMEKYFLPYYRFYVELPEEEQEDGMKMFGIYYVPAVEERYITKIPAGEIQFN